MKDVLYEVRCLKSNEDIEDIVHVFHTTFLSRENMSPTN